MGSGLALPHLRSFNTLEYGNARPDPNLAAMAPFIINDTMKGAFARLLLSFCIFFPLVGCEESPMSTEGGEGFRFEDFQSEDDVVLTLKALHPIGSKLQPLLQALQNSGAICEDQFKKYGEEYKNGYNCKYEYSSFLITVTWQVGIRYTDDMSIENIYSSKYLTGL